MKFYVFRHGQTDWNKESRIQGSTNTELNDQGREDAKGLIPLMEKLRPEIIYTSDLNRAFDTGKTVADALGIPIIKEARLREANFGQAEGMTVPEIIEKWGAQMWEDFRRINPDNREACFPDGETRGDSVKRMRSVVDEIRAAGEYERVGLSTHGGVVRNLLHSYLPPESESLPIPNCVTYLLEFKEGEVTVEGPLKF
ncbi:MAG: histidine phosphatase family protein [Bdellovibrionota bacterium]|nr:histidine phosphatase family protein [Bdellovibrionota bacterium]